MLRPFADFVAARGAHFRDTVGDLAECKITVPAQHLLAAPTDIPMTTRLRERTPAKENAWAANETLIDGLGKPIVCAGAVAHRCKAAHKHIVEYL